MTSRLYLCPPRYSPAPSLAAALTHYYELRYISHMARKLTAGPFSDPELLILASLAEGRKHGYAIMTDVLTFSDVELGPGTLYAAITRLVEMGWIEPCEPSGRQRPYQLTPSGGRHLQTQLAKMRDLARIGLKRLRAI
jgi:DNA-binding PadR family transcriptional regulator